MDIWWFLYGTIIGVNIGLLMSTVKIERCNSKIKQLQDDKRTYETLVRLYREGKDEQH